jgi:cob(I)alamin adenosyltransferase
MQMRITKVYTKSGDDGQTSLVGGLRVPKNHPRITSYGSVDELNSILGIVRTYLQVSNVSEDVKTNLDTMLFRIQNHLFNVGADLATPTDHRWEGMIRVGDTDVTWLEESIDLLNDDLEPLKEFILPGGGPVGAFFHQARTVCRRAERDVLTLMDHDSQVDNGPMKYLNRLSDFLFVAGRWAAKSLGEQEYYWTRD